MSATSIFSRLQTILPVAKVTRKPLAFSSSPVNSINFQQQKRRMKTKEVLTLEEAAQYLQIDPQTLVLEVTRGVIPGCQLGGKWRFSVTALEKALSKYLEGNNVNFELIPDPDWEYSDTWTTCIEIRQIIRTVQEMMLSGHNIHDLVVASPYQWLGKLLRQFYQQTETREEELQYQYFHEISVWKKRAQNYYWNYKLSLGTCVSGGIPKYQLLFQDLSSSEMVTDTSELPVQNEWASLDEFWHDSRRYDFKYFRTPKFL